MDLQPLPVTFAVSLVASLVANAVYARRSGATQVISGEPLFWSVVVVFFLALVLTMGLSRWLVPLWAAYLTAAGAAAVAAGMVFLVSGRSWPAGVKLAVTVAVPGLGVLVIDPLFPSNVSLRCPEEVRQETVVHGWVDRSAVSTNVLVHPMRSAEWWVQQIPVPDRSGRWHAKSVFGGQPGDLFEVMAVSVSDGSLYEEGSAIHPSQIPESAYRSDVCLVRRGSQ